MSWAKYAIERLALGQTVDVRPSGSSMSPRINNKEQVTLTPCDPASLAVGDVVLVRVSGNVLLHLIKAIEPSKRRMLIANNRGRINGWANFNKVYGVATEANGRPLR